MMRILFRVALYFQKRLVEIPAHPTPTTSEYKLFRNEAIADVISKDEVILVPKFNAIGDLMRRGDRNTGRRRLCGIRGRDWSGTPLNQGMLRVANNHQKPG